MTEDDNPLVSETEPSAGLESGDPLLGSAPQALTSAPDVVQIEPSARRTAEERREAERNRILNAVASGKAEILLERTAWILSRWPHTRDSDIALQIQYWKEFEPERYAELADDSKVLYRLTRLTSLSRARARIQNTHRLFQASPEIRKRRGRLSEEERERLATAPVPSPIITVYADESGKTGQHLIVGSVWFLDPIDTLSVQNRVSEWRASTRFDAELHFAEVTQRTLDRYCEFVDVVIDSTALISFKSVSVPRAGIGSVEDALHVLFYELIRQGVQHEDETGRAPLPRRVLVWKDLEQAGSDRIMLARLRDALATASGSQFAGKLFVEECEAIDSRDQPLVQLADLYTSSINRTLARAPGSDRPKDRLAHYLLGRVRGMPGDERVQRLSANGTRDMEIHIRL